MTEDRASHGASDQRTAAHQTLRSVLPKLAEPIVNQVRELVPALGGADGGKRHQLMTAAAAAAFRAYVAAPEDRDSELRKVDELFRRLGWGEAQSFDASIDLPFTLTVGTATATRYLSAYAHAHGLPQSAAYDVVDDLLHFTEHLREELMEGYALGLRNPDRARRKLWGLLTERAEHSGDRPADGLDQDQMHEYASLCGWEIPEQCVALAFDDPATAAHLARNPAVLSGHSGEWHLILVDAAHEQTILDEIASISPRATVTVAWPTSLENAHAGVRWAVRTGKLVRLGIAPSRTVVRCDDHATQLWLHADPLLREVLAQEVLAPLMAESYNSRAILSETLLTWLETRDSAPAIAARLEVHPQTVRYRWRRINELFGESMQDPEFLVMLTLLLKATVPLWQAGDRSDITRFKSLHELPEDVDTVGDDPRLT